MRHLVIFRKAGWVGLSILIGGTIAAPVLATERDLTPGDKTFVQQASQAGAAEVKASDTAQSRTQNKDVRAFAAMMVEDHTAAGDKLEGIAKRKQISASALPDAEHVAAIRRLEGLRGAQFDKAYVDLMVKDHRDAVALFEKASHGSVSDPDLQQFATQTLPVLRRHDEHAQKLSHLISSM